MTEERKLKQISTQLYEDQLKQLDKLWKLKLLDSRNDLIRITIDKLLEDNKALLKDK
jgi:metal-responsive CopG/Arc/MetJ family transcriptional regulator